MTVDRTRLKVRGFERRWARAGGDLCTLVPAALEDQGDGHTLIEGTPVPNVPCIHEQLGGGGVQVNDNGTSVTKTHRVELESTAEALLIDRHYKIKVAPRDLIDEMVFEQPVKQIKSFSPVIIVLATLAEGYRRPGVM